MKFVEVLLAVPPRPTDLSLRAHVILEKVCAAAYATEFPEGISADEIDDTVSQMRTLDDEGVKIADIAEKARQISPSRSSGQLFI